MWAAIGFSGDMPPGATTTSRSASPTGPIRTARPDRRRAAPLDHVVGARSAVSAAAGVPMKALVVGSGAGGAVAAMVLARPAGRRGVREGRPLFGDLRRPRPGRGFPATSSSGARGFDAPDTSGGAPHVPAHATDAEPATWGRSRTCPDGRRRHRPLGRQDATVLGHRLPKRSLLGPVDGRRRRRLALRLRRDRPGLRRDRGADRRGRRRRPAAGRPHPAPRAPEPGAPMPAGPPQLASLLAAAGCRARRGCARSRCRWRSTASPYDGRPACNNCGQCAHHGCPIQARTGALAPLRRACWPGPRCAPTFVVVKVEVSGRRATGVTWLDASAEPRTERATWWCSPGCHRDGRGWRCCPTCPIPTA